MQKKSQRIIFLDFWKRTERKLQSFDWERDEKPKAKLAENPLRKEQGKERLKERGREKNKAMAARLVFMTSLEIVFEGRAFFGCNPAR